MPERVPSDNIYLFQHRANSFDKCHFVARNPNSIRTRLADDPDNKELRRFCNELEAVYDFHAVSADVRPLNPEEQHRAEAFMTGASAEVSAEPQPGKAYDFESLSSACPTAANLLRVLAFFQSSAPVPRSLIAEAHYQLSLALYRALHAEAADSMCQKGDKIGKDQDHRALRVRKREEKEEDSPPQLPDCLVRELKKRAREKDLYWLVHALRDGFKERNEAVEALVQHGVLTRQYGVVLINVPPQIASETLAQMDQLEKRVFGECAFRALETLTPDRDSIRGDISLFDALVCHAKVCRGHIQQFDIQLPEFNSYIHQVADYLLHRGNYIDGEVFWRWAVEAAEALAASVEADANLRPRQKKDIAKRCFLVVALDLGYLAEDLRLAGKPESAEGAMLRAIAIYEKYAGHDKNFDNLIALHNLGLIYRDMGKLQEAKAMFNRVEPQLSHVAPPGVLAEALEDYGCLLTSMGEEADGSALRERARVLRGEIGE